MHTLVVLLVFSNSYLLPVFFPALPIVRLVEAAVLDDCPPVAVGFLAYRKLYRQRSATVLSSILSMEVKRIRNK